MANNVYTWVHVKCTDKMVLKELREKLTPPNGKYELHTAELGQRFFDYDEDFNPTNGDNSDNFGAKWVYVEEPEDVDDYEMSFMCTSAWNTPQLFMERIRDWCCARDMGSMVWGNFEDESIVPYGGFFYSKNKDYFQKSDEDIDYDKVWDDDEYREELDNRRMAIQDELYQKGTEI